MTPIHTLILGIIQGLTEFLPVSSSGHLVLVPYLLGWHFPEHDAFIFNVLVQVATLVAVIVYFLRDLIHILDAFLQGIWIRKPFATLEARMGWYLILATIPAGIVGLVLKDFFESIFNNPVGVAFFLLITALLLIIAERIGKGERVLPSITWLDALWMGIFQAAAILPGVSRSGSTISGGRMRGLDRAAAARFSFLMSIPIMLAAGLLATLDLIKMPNLNQLWLTFLPGFIAAAVVGYLSIHWLLHFLMRGKLYGFAIYCAAISIITLVYSVLVHP
jgi:undecaprenyl-diphosphatase